MCELFGSALEGAKRFILVEVSDRFEESFVDGDELFFGFELFFEFLAMLSAI